MRLQVSLWLQSLLPRDNSRLRGRKDFSLYLLPPSNRSILFPVFLLFSSLSTPVFVIVGVMKIMMSLNVIENVEA